MGGRGGSRLCLFIDGGGAAGGRERWDLWIMIH